MVGYLSKYKIVCWLILITFSVSCLGVDVARASSVGVVPQNAMMVPPGSLISSSPAFSLPTLRAISVDPKDPFRIDFAVDTGDLSEQKNLDQAQINLLIKYFLGFLTIPEKELWVNLSPYEKNRIITPTFENTNAGRDMLLQDYMLKQLAASLTHPDHELGKVFWKKVYTRVKAEYGTNYIPVNSFNKVWVVPDKAVVYEEKGSAFIGESRLKVLTEEDYLSNAKNRASISKDAVIERKNIDKLSSEITREVIIPELEREVNEGKYFAPLRQMYTALILAIWFKSRLKNSLINHVYVNQQKTDGLNLNETQIKEKIYTQYLKALKKGAYNFVREDYDEISQHNVPRKYYSGGFAFADAAMKVSYLPSSQLDSAQLSLSGAMTHVAIALKSIGIPNRTLLSVLAGSMLSIGAVETAEASSSQGSVYPALQQALSQIEGNVSSILGSHPQAMGYEKLNQLVTAVDNLPQGTAIYEHGQQLKEALLNQDFLEGNVKRRNAFFDRVPGVSPESPQWQRVNGLLKQMRMDLQNSQTPTHSPANLSKVDKPVSQAEQLSPVITKTTKPIINPQVEVVQTPVVKPAVVETVVPVPVGTSSAPVTTPPAVVQPAVRAPTVPAVTPAPAIAPSETTATAPTTLHISSPATTIPAAPATVVSTNTISRTVPAIATHVPLSEKITQIKTTGMISPEKIVPFLPSIQGKVVGLSAGKKTYQMNETMFYVLDPNLMTQIDIKSTQLNLAKKRLTESMRLYGEEHPSTLEDKKNVYDLESELTQLNLQKQAGAVIAPCDLTVEGGFLITNGKFVTQSTEMFRYRNNQRAWIHIDHVPSGLNSFNRINVVVDGKTIESLGDINFDFKSDQQTPQVSVLAYSTNAFTFGSVQDLRMTVYMPQNSTAVNSVASKNVSLGKVNSPRYIVENLPPLEGQLEFFVREGHYVSQGQLIGRVVNSEYEQQFELDYKRLVHLNTMIGKETLPNGTLVKDDDGSHLRQLMNERIALIANLKNLYDLIESGKLYASHSGIVTKIIEGARSKEEFMHISSMYAEIGNGNDILFPNDLTIKIGDPVWVSTPQGFNIPARITSIAPAPSNADFNEGQNSVRILGFDKYHILQPGLPVTIHLVDPNHREEIEAQIAIIENGNRQAPAGSPPPPKDNLFNALLNPNATTTAVTNTYSIPQPYRVGATNSFSSVLQDIEDRVLGNPLMTEDGKLDVFLSEKQKDLIRRTKFDLLASVYITPDGNVAFSGGFDVFVKNLVGGGLSYGSAYGALQPVVNTLIAKGSDLVFGKTKKAVEVAEQNKAITRYRSHIQLMDILTKAKSLRINIGSLNQQILQIQARLIEIKKTQTQLSSSTRLSDEALRQIAKNIADLEYELQQLEGQQKTDSISLSLLIGPSTNNSNGDSWSVDVPIINTNQINSMRTNLISRDSPNPRMQEALALTNLAGKIMIYQGIESLPEFAATSAYSSKGSLSGSLLDPKPNPELRTTGIKEGFTGGVQGSYTVYDSGRNDRKQMAAAQQEKARLNLEKVKSELAADFDKTIENLETILGLIKNREQLRQQLIIQLKEQAGVINPLEKIKREHDIFQLDQELIELEAKKKQELVKLEALGFRFPQGVADNQPTIISRVNTITFDNSNYASIAPTNLFQAFVPVEPMNRDGILNVTTVHYHVGNVVNAWIQMSANSSPTNTASGNVNTVIPSQTPLQRLAEILITQENRNIRAEAFTLLNQYQKDGQYLSEVMKIIQQSPFADVRLKLLDIMSQQTIQNQNVIFQTIENAVSRQDHVLAQIGFQALTDMINLHPDFMKDLSNSVAMDKVLVTLLLREPPDSMLVQNVLQSEFWSSDDLARIYKSLKKHIQQHPHDLKVKQLADLLADAAWRKIALNHLDSTFSLGRYETLMPNALYADIFTKITILREKEQNRKLLFSSSWRNRDLLYPKLRKDAEGILNEAIQQADESAAGDLFFSGYVEKQLIEDDIKDFKQKGIERQRKDIESSNIVRLGRFLTVETPLQGEILARLLSMPGTQGRVQAFNAYLNSTNAKFMTAFESQVIASQDKLKNELVTLSEDAASNDILRRALNKFYTAHPDQQWARDLIAYADPELHTLPDGPYKESLIKAASIEAGRDIFIEKANHRIKWGKPGEKLSEAEDREISLLEQRLNKSRDPQALIDHIKLRLQKSKNSEATDMLKKIVSLADQYAQKISRNDQRFANGFNHYLGDRPLELCLSWLVVPMLTLGSLTAKFVKRWKYKNWRKTASEEDLITDLYTKLFLDEQDEISRGELSIPPPSKHIVISPKEEVFKFVTENLETWYGLLVTWEKQQDIKPEDILDDLRKIHKGAERIFQDMPFNTNLIYDEHGDHPDIQLHNEVYNYLNLLLISTAQLLKKRLNLESISNPKLKTELNREIARIHTHFDYASDFSYQLFNRSNIIEVVLPYKYPDRKEKSDSQYRSFYNKYLLYPFLRTALLLNRLLVKSRVNFENKLPELLRKGNLCTRGLYPDEEGLTQKINKVLDKVIKEVIPAYASQDKGSSSKGKNRRYLSRRNGFLFGPVVLLMSGLFYYFKLPLIFGGGASVLGILAMLNHYVPHWNYHNELARMDTYHEMMDLMSKLKSGLATNNAKVTPVQKTSIDDDVETIKVYQQLANEEVQRELNESKHVDMIVLISSDSSRSAELQNFLDRKKIVGPNQLIRGDTPARVMTSDKRGRNNVYFDVLLKLKEAFERGDYKQEYPDLSSWEKARIVFIFHGDEAAEDKDIEGELLEWGIKTGYSAAKNGDATHDLRNILISTRNPYFGPIPKFASTGCTMPLARVNHDNLMESILPETDRSGEKIIRLHDVKATLAPKGSSRRYKEYVKDRFNSDNKEMEQYPVLNETIVLSKDAVQAAIQTAEYMKRTKLWDRLSLSFIADTVNSVLKGNESDDNKDVEFEDYASRRINSDGNIIIDSTLSNKEAKELLQEFYRNNYRNWREIKFRGHSSPSSSEVLLHIAGAVKNAERLRYKRLMQKVRNADPAQLSADNGGIDLSNTANMMGSTIQENNLGLEMTPNNAFKAFHGFEFEVIKYQPILNPSELFSSSSIDRRGSWFYANQQKNLASSGV